MRRRTKVTKAPEDEFVHIRAGEFADNVGWYCDTMSPVEVPMAIDTLPLLRMPRATTTAGGGAPPVLTGIVRFRENVALGPEIHKKCAKKRVAQPKQAEVPVGATATATSSTWPEKLSRWLAGS